MYRSGLGRLRKYDLSHHRGSRCAARYGRASVGPAVRRKDPTRSSARHVARVGLSAGAVPYLCVVEHLNSAPSGFTPSSVVAPVDPKLGDHRGETIQYEIPNASVNL